MGVGVEICSRSGGMGWDGMEMVGFVEGGGGRGRKG